MNTDLIPRKTLFGNPDRASVRLSRDGKQIAWLAPVDGVLNVWVAPRERLEDARPVTHDEGRGIRMFVWTYTNNHILYIQDKAGDENWRLYAVDLSNDAVSELTPMDGVQARILNLSPDFPDEVLVGLNNRVPQLHDVQRLNFVTGEMSLLCENPQFVEILTDDHFQVRQAYAVTPDGGMAVFRQDGGEWKPVDSVPSEDSLTTYPAGFAKDRSTLYLSDSRGRNTSALYAQDFETLEKTLIAENDRADLSQIVVHPTQKTIQAVAFDYERREWTVLDPTFEAHLKVLRGVRDGDVEVVSRALDDSAWIVSYEVDDGAVPYYLYDTATKTATYLFSSRDDLEAAPLVHMHPATIKTRDGLDMVIYYSLPEGSDSDGDGVPDSPIPMVLYPHGGPWARDRWGYDSMHQWIANRGYAVMTVNFRSSTGFGKSFANAGNFEWGGKILEDQIDAVNWAVENHIADAAKVAVMGGSFGGYSTLAGLTMHPEVYACGVDIVGPSNLITLLESVPEYWKPMLDMLKSRVGDNETEEGKALLKKHSPLTYVDNIKKPLLIGQGANDPRVKQAESDQIVSAMQAKGIPVTYVLYPDEGHGFARPENRLSFFAVAEAFLAEHLGGRFEPVGADFADSSIEIKAGRDDIQGLPA